MRFRDAVKFSLELFLPERAVLAVLPVERLALERPAEAVVASPEPTEPTLDVEVPDHRSRSMIEDLDSRQFGGPSFGPQSIALMSRALEETLAMLPQPVPDDLAHTIAATILKKAAEGERDPVRLRTSAMSALKPDEAATIAAPPG
jgi:hypothetical protein